MDKPSEIKVGQIWADNDIRSKYDEFTVVSLVRDSNKPDYAVCQRGPRKVNIRVDRLLGPVEANRGYRYIGMQR